MIFILAAFSPRRQLCYTDCPAHLNLVNTTVTFRPKRLLEQIKGISEQKATKILVEGKPLFCDR